MVDYFGERDRPLNTLISVIVIFILQNFIKNRINYNYCNKLCYDVAYPFICFRTAFTAFSLMRNNKNRLTFYSIIIGLMGPCLMRLYERMDTQKSLDSYFYKTVNKMVTNKIHKKFLVIVLFIIWLVPNVRYILVGDNYIISLIPVILFTLIVLISMDIFLETMRRK